MSIYINSQYISNQNSNQNIILTNLLIQISWRCIKFYLNETFNQLWYFLVNSLSNIFVPCSTLALSTSVSFHIFLTRISIYISNIIGVESAALIDLLFVLAIVSITFFRYVIGAHENNCGCCRALNLRENRGKIIRMP